VIFLNCLYPQTILEYCASPKTSVKSNIAWMVTKLAFRPFSRFILEDLLTFHLIPLVKTHLDFLFALSMMVYFGYFS
jgi:hypothetical protein